MTSFILNSGEEGQEFNNFCFWFCLKEQMHLVVHVHISLHCKKVDYILCKGLFTYYVTQLRWVGAFQNITIPTYAIGEILRC